MAGMMIQPAQARVFVGFGFGGPYYYPHYYAPPIYYPPPVYYAAPPPVVYTPPPVVYTPPPAMSRPAGQMCYAGAYSCPMDQPVYSGSSCYCMGNGGQRVWGHAN